MPYGKGTYGNKVGRPPKKARGAMAAKPRTKADDKKKRGVRGIMGRRGR